MAKVKIQGNASGTGTVTLTAPNTNNDRTITLPDSTGTVLMTDGDGSNLSIVGVDGIVSTANATAITIDSSEQVFIDSIQNKTLNSGGWGLTVKDTTTGGGAGVGGAIAFTSLRSDGGAFNSGAISGVKTNATGTNEKGDLAFYTGSGVGGALAEKLRITSDGRGLSQFTAKAWMFGNPGVVTDSHNISSYDDDGTGLSELHMTNACANANFAALLGSARAKGDTDSFVKSANESYTRARTTSSVAFITSYTNGSSTTMQDAWDTSIAIFGD